MASNRFPILFTGLSRAMVALGITPASSYVEVSENELTVRLSWAFRASVPLGSITSATDDHDRVFGWGAHGWAGTWLVNGSSDQIVRITIEPEGKAQVMGIPVKLNVLRVSVEDPAGLKAALAT